MKLFENHEIARHLFLRVGNLKFAVVHNHTTPKSGLFCYGNCSLLTLVKDINDTGVNQPVSDHIYTLKINDLMNWISTQKDVSVFRDYHKIGPITLVWINPQQPIEQLTLETQSATLKIGAINRVVINEAQEFVGVEWPSEGNVYINQLVKNADIKMNTGRLTFENSAQLMPNVTPTAPAFERANITCTGPCHSRILNKLYPKMTYNLKPSPLLPQYAGYKTFHFSNTMTIQSKN